MSNNFEIKKATYASHIRVNRGLYYHHGIYLSDDCVIHFGGTDSDNILDPSKARVIKTNLDDFLKGGILEVRNITQEEAATIRSSQDIANYAFASLGNAGYDLVNNNCEHFANECLFGEKKSMQVNEILSKIFAYMK